MPRPKNERPVSVKIYQSDYDGLWHGYITVGKKGNGKPDVRHRTAKTEPECTAKIRKLEDEMSAGRVAEAGQVPTLEQWLNQWLAETVSDLRYATQERSYGWAVKNHLIPGLGGHRLDAPDLHRRIQMFYRKLAETKSARGKLLSSASIASIHRTLRAALNEAKRQGRIPVSPMEKVRPPQSEDEEITPLFVDEVKRILAACEGRRNGTRWSVGMPLGLRQGEALGLTWMRESTSTRDRPFGLDLDAGYVNIAQKAERRTWQHGCADPHRCAKWAHGCSPIGECGGPAWECPRKEVRCRLRGCQPPWEHGCGDRSSCYTQAWRCRRRRAGQCRSHRRACPAPCPPDCTGHARACPQRTGGGIVMGDTKSTAGRRRAKLGRTMLELMLAHRDQQDAEREYAADLWVEHNLVWCGPTGKPIDPGADWRDWKALLREAGVRDARIHDGRHTAATMLLLQGVDPRVVMELMGWADSRMLKRYQHVLDELLTDTADRMGALLWNEKPAEPTPAAAPDPEPVAEVPAQLAPAVNDGGSSTDLATGKVLMFRPRTSKKPSTRR